MQAQNLKGGYSLSNGTAKILRSLMTVSLQHLCFYTPYRI